MTSTPTDRALYLYFWIKNGVQAGTCTCGKEDGHTGWLVCFHDDWTRSQA